MSEPSILKEIVARKVQQIEQQKQAMPLSQFRESLQYATRDFGAAIGHPSPGFILECKKASPSQGLIRDDFDLVSIASVYGRYASAISVLTESEYFQGSLANLGIVRQHARQPLLCKDFFVDPYQVWQARHFGADAILLILAILDDRQWIELSGLAQSLGMQVLTEVSNEREAERAVALQAGIVGINNRNLHDMSIDLNTTRRLAAGLPETVTVVSESGYLHHRQLRSMADCSDAFLIGSSLMADPNLSLAVKAAIFGECKVCGLTRAQDAISVDAAGAVYGGVIFAESSPRCVTPQQANQLFQGTQLKRVGVFQDAAASQIREIATACQLDVVQLHGNEAPSLVQQLLNWPHASYNVWKALSVHQLPEWGESWLAAGASRLVVDHQTGRQKGGTGRAFDWSLLPAENRDRVILAGGIGAENVALAAGMGCAGVDMNSRLESAPGIKSDEKIRSAFAAIRQYSS